MAAVRVIAAVVESVTFVDLPEVRCARASAAALLHARAQNDLLCRSTCAIFLPFLESPLHQHFPCADWSMLAANEAAGSVPV